MRLIAINLLLCLSSYSSFGETLIIREVETSETINNEADNFEYSIDERLVILNTDVLLTPGIKEFDLELFPGVVLICRFERKDKRSNNDFTWYGKIKNVGSSLVVLSVKNKKVAGEIWYEGTLSGIRPVANGMHKIFEVNSGELPQGAPPVRVNKPPFDYNKQGVSFGSSSDVRISSEDDGSVIDVMVVYTANAANQSGNITSEIQLAVDATNQYYANSGISFRIRLIKMIQVNYEESGSTSTDLERLADPDDGYMDSIHSKRRENGADIVSLWLSSGDSGGRAYILTKSILNTSGSWHLMWFW